MSSSGLAATTIRSASLPVSTVPNSAPTPHTAAPCRVAATSVCQGVAPSRTHSPISSSAASLRGRMSEPNAIRTPASSALRNHVACTSEAASARQHSRMREPAVGNPSGFERVGGLAGRKMADGEGRHVPRIVLVQERDALVIHDVAMLDAMGAEPDRILHCIRVGGMRHDLEAALPADLEGSADLVVEQERMGVEVPCRPHDAAREVKLDMVDAVLDLLADGFHPTIGAVNLQRMTRGQEMSARGGEEITASEQPRADMLSGVEGPLPCDVHEVMGASAAQSDNAGLGKRGCKPVAEQGHLIGEWHLVEGQVIGMDMHIPKPGHQVPAFEIDHLRVAGAARLSAWQDGADAAILDQHGTIRPYLGLDAVDQVRMRKDCLHGGLFGLKSEILGSTAAPKRRSASPASGDWRRPPLANRASAGRHDRKVV